MHSVAESVVMFLSVFMQSRIVKRYLRCSLYIELTDSLRYLMLLQAVALLLLICLFVVLSLPSHCRAKFLPT